MTPLPRPKAILFDLDDTLISSSGERQEVWAETLAPVIHRLGGHGATEGGDGLIVATELLQRLAEVYVGPGVKFPPFDDPPPGHVIRITVERVGGLGPWTS